ncbi:MAG: hypothetical protein AAB597_02600 [Patescibacteria group bacterium]
MEANEEEERRRLVAEGARKQLAEGTWPQVMGVFGYRNPKAPRTPDEEFVRLKALYGRADCSNMAEFVDLVRFAEKEHGVAMSFNLSMRRRLVPGEAPESTAQNAMLLFSCPDILVGTRNGLEGAAVWLKNCYEAVQHLPPESVQVMDKIFGEALGFLKGPSRMTTVEDMLRSAVLGEGDALKPADIPSKH